MTDGLYDLVFTRPKDERLLVDGTAFLRDIADYKLTSADKLHVF